jgi:hypothetical protein
MRLPFSRWRQRHPVEESFEQGWMGTSEEARGGGGAAGAADVRIVHGSERCELVVAEAMAAMVRQRKLTVARARSTPPGCVG